jgi:hypothetical protein
VSVNLINYFEDSSARPIDSLPQELKRHFLRVASQTINNNHVLVEARRHPRHRIHESALAVRLNESNEPVGPPFQIFIMDISAGGVGFIHTRAFPSGRLAVRLSGMSGFSVVMIGRIVRCICRNRAYEIGMEFVERAAKETSPSEEEFNPYMQPLRRETREPAVKSDTHIIQNKRCI